MTSYKEQKDAVNYCKFKKVTNWWKLKRVFHNPNSWNCIVYHTYLDTNKEQQVKKRTGVYLDGYVYVFPEEVMNHYVFSLKDSPNAQIVRYKVDKEYRVDNIAYYNVNKFKPF